LDVILKTKSQYSHIPFLFGHRGNATNPLFSIDSRRFKVCLNQVSAIPDLPLSSQLLSFFAERDSCAFDPGDIQLNVSLTQALR